MIRILDIYPGNPFSAEETKAAGFSGVIIKGGQGSYSEYFATGCKYIDDCKRVGLPYGIYWLPDARYPPEPCKAAIKTYFPDGNFGQLGLWLDCEKWNLSVKDDVYSAAPYAFYKPIESIWRGIYAYTGRYPGIYTSPGAWNLIFGRIPALLAQEFADKSLLWTAQYGVTKPQLYGKWTEYTFWQYQAEPDHSVFGGDAIDFEDLFGPQPSPIEIPPVVTQGGTTVKGVAKSDVNVKPMAGGNAVGTLRVGEVIYGKLTLLTPTGQDLIDINRIYRPDGVTISRELPVPCKVSVGNWLAVTSGTEPVIPPSPPPPPSPVGVVKTHQIDVMSDGSILVDGKLIL